ELLENIDHRGGGAGGFPSAVQLGADTAGVGLFFVFDKQDFVDDGALCLHGEVHQRVGDGGGDEIRVFGGSPEDEAEGDDAGGSVAIDDGGDGDGDFKSSGDA